MKVAVVGTGYVGLVTGISLAKFGHKVICVEKDTNKVLSINKGESPFYEININSNLKQVTKKGLLRATQSLKVGVTESEIIIIAVGTPTVNNKIDLTSIKKVSQQIGKALVNTKKYQVIAVKSTVLPGVTQEVIKPILEKYSKKKVGDFGLCMSPEFLREGSALDDALHPDRIVIGQYDDKSGKEFAKIYAKLSVPKIFTDLWTAEMIKYAANALLATLISYANEIARIAESTGKVDVVDVWQGVHMDKRLSSYHGKIQIKPGILNYILSGCGFGGSCLPKDTKALANFADELGVEAKLIKSVIDINRTQPHRMILLLKDALGKRLKGKRIAVLGLAFKPNSDDTRESPSFSIIKELLLEKVEVICHDPYAYKKKVPKELGNLSVILANTVQEAVKDSDATIIVTAWEEYEKLTPNFFKQNMKQPIIIDGRRIYDKRAFQQAGILYKGVGL